MTVASTKILRKCCAVDVPNEEEMWATLKRKQQHCLTGEDRRHRDAAMANRCSLDGHGVSMAKTYTAAPLSMSAFRAKEEYGKHHGPPPGFLPHEECMRKEPESRRRLFDGLGVTLEHPRAHVSTDSDTGSSSAESVNADQAQMVAVGDIFDLSTAPNPFGDSDEGSNSGCSGEAVPSVSLPNDSSVRSFEADGGSNVTDPPLFHPVPRLALPSDPPPTFSSCARFSQRARARAKATRTQRQR